MRSYIYLGNREAAVDLCHQIRELGGIDLIYTSETGRPHVTSATRAENSEDEIRSGAFRGRSSTKR